MIVSYIYNSAVQVIEKRWDGDRYNRDGQNRAGIGTEILGTVGDMFHGNARTFNVSYLLGIETSYSTRVLWSAPTRDNTAGETGELPTFSTAVVSQLHSNHELLLVTRVFSGVDKYSSAEQRDRTTILRGWVTLRLNFRFKGYVSC